MKKNLYLMRHGQTLFNLQHKIQGWCDSPLTDLGRYQAEKAREYVKDIRFDHICSSTSERACDTAEIMAPGRSYERVKGLKEWNFGVFEAKDECLNPKLPYGDFFVQFGGDSEMGLRKRMKDTLTEIMERPDYHTVLAVSHGAACAQFYRAFEEYAEVKKKERFYNCCILHFEFDTETKIFALKELFNRNITEME
jgi:broad specificity phosphatase PhoE